MSLPPWAYGPFELLVHAEGHLRNGEDFDRRIALISFDNAVEVAVTTYLSLKPIMRGNREYQRADVDTWLSSYNTKLDFFEKELSDRGLNWEVEKSHILWAHQHRNEQYHGGSKGTPEKQVLKIIRTAALWIFSVLYDVDNVEQVLEGFIGTSAIDHGSERNAAYDRAIDREYGMIEVAGSTYYSSEILLAVDEIAYQDEGSRLCGTTTAPEDDLTKGDSNEE